MRIYYPQLTSFKDTQVEFQLEGKAAHHILTVLRRKAGDTLILFDGQNNEYSTLITQIDKKRLWVRLIDSQTINRESALNIHLIQGISKGERMDWVVQKATELGVSCITPVHTQHGAVSLNNERTLKKQEHWENIIISACEQCGRNSLPLLNPIQSFSDMLSCTKKAENEAYWILHPENENKSPLHPLYKGGRRGNFSAIHLLIGPEGGFSTSEVMQANKAGFEPIQFGPRILRTETAAIAVIAALQTLLGDSPL